MGSDVATDWKVGSTIVWTGEYEGKPYTDTGTILQIEPEKLLQYTHGGTADMPEEKYHLITITLHEEED